MEKIMNYYLIDNIAVSSELHLTQNGYPNAYKLTKAKYLFAVNNPSASISEIKAGKLNEPTAEELLQVAKNVKLAQLNASKQQFEQQGYFDTITEWTLFTGQEDVENYNKLKNALADQVNTFPCEIGTFTGWHISTKGVVYPLLTRYSAYMLPATTSFMKIKSYIDFAQTIEQVESIVW
jgi:hypothetical protein